MGCPTETKSCSRFNLFLNLGSVRWGTCIRLLPSHRTWWIGVLYYTIFLICAVKVSFACAKKIKKIYISARKRISLHHSSKMSKVSLTKKRVFNFNHNQKPKWTEIRGWIPLHCRNLPLPHTTIPTRRGKPTVFSDKVTMPRSTISLPICKKTMTKSMNSLQFEFRI